MREASVILFALLLVKGVSASTQAHVAHSVSSIALFLAISAPFIASILIFVFYERLKDLSAYLGSLSGLVSFLAVLTMVGQHGEIVYPWIPSLEISFSFYVDGLSLLVGTLASGIGILVFLYSRAYMDHGKWKRKYYTTLTVFMGSMIGLVFSSNLIMMFLFWELTSVCSFLLISHNQRKSSGILASKKSLLITVGSGMMLLAGIIIIGSSLGTFSLAKLLANGNVTQTLISDGLYIPVLLLVGIGAAAKSAQVPLHIWLPDAMEAPTPVSSFLHSATMVKAGVFLLGRMRPLLMQSQMWNMLFIVLGLTTMTIMALCAIGSEELKELLAYSTASHLGLIVAGLGFSSVLGGETAVFHILNHAVFKASLFMVAGIVLHEVGTQKIEELSGLRHEWPLLGVIATISGLSMAGIPPFNGFYSKELLLKSTYHLASASGGLTWFLPFIAVLGSIFTFLYSFRFISVFYGENKRELQDLPNLMVFPPALLALMVCVIGLAPNYFIKLLVEPALHSISIETHHMSVHLPTNLKAGPLMSLIVISSGALVFKYAPGFHKPAKNITKNSLSDPNQYYNLALQSLDRLSNYIVELTETSLLRTYATWLIATTSIISILAYLNSGKIPVETLSATNPVLIVLLTSIISVYAVIRSKKYISSVLTLSILGFMVSIYYLLMDAPDLVMTQLVVETLALIIFLLVLDKLPKFNEKISDSRKFRDIILAGLAGLTVFMSVLYSTMEQTPSKVADYYIEHAIPGSGGSNIVNVILVDFRGLDTLGEISVIAMAGLSVYMLFKMRGEKQ